jgi:hypothetical protein
LRSKKKDAPKPKIFSEEITELKYLFLIERIKFGRGETTYEVLHEKADALLQAIEVRQTQIFGGNTRRRMKLCAAELIANPFFYLSEIPLT